MEEMLSGVVQVVGVVAMVVLMSVACCALLKCRKKRALKRMGYGFVQSHDSEFYSTDAEIGDMTEMDIDGI